MRKIADYELNNLAIETAKQAKFQLERASEIEHRLQTCTEGSNLEALRTEMVAYRTKAKVQ